VPSLHIIIIIIIIATAEASHRRGGSQSIQGCGRASISEM
jgi:hypothetical protein